MQAFMHLGASCNPHWCCFLFSEWAPSECMAVGRRFFFFWLLMFLVHQMAVAMFRLMGAIGRTLVTATTLGSTLVLFIVTLNGFVLAYPQVSIAAAPVVTLPCTVHVSTGENTASAKKPRWAKFVLSPYSPSHSGDLIC